MHTKLYKKILKNKKGSAALISVFFFMFVGVAVVTAVVGPVVRDFKVASESLSSRLSYFTAESGIEDAIYRVKNSMTVGSSNSITLNGATVTTEVTDFGTTQKQIVSSGNLNNINRSITALVQVGSGASFNYGVQVGLGGLDLQSSTINGNVYANGPITSDGSSNITGTAISANSSALAADQSNGSGTPAYGINFGDTNATRYMAQSFQVSADGPVNKVSVYIKKTSTPGNAGLQLRDDNSGDPGSNLVENGTVVTGTLSASSVGTSYGWVDISFNVTKYLYAGTTYWFILGPSVSSTKYYTIGASSGGYSSGAAKTGTGSTGGWSNTSPSGLDYFFSLYTGGVNGSITGQNVNNKVTIGSSGVGDAKAHSVSYVSAAGSIYCASGTSNNKSCTSATDPSYIAMPISDSNITSWETEAAAGGTYSGNYSVSGGASVSYGPKKITGNLTVSGGGTLTLTGPLWVTGNVTLSGGGTIKLASTYGSGDEVIVADGIISISGGGNATGSGTTGSYIVMVTNNATTNAADISGGAGAVVLYAAKGTISLSGGASLKEATGYRVTLQGGSTLSYESGLDNLNFNSGPSGSWSVDSWNETQ